MNKLLIGFQALLLATYLVAFQISFNAEFKGYDSFVKAVYVDFLWWAVIAVSPAVGWVLYRDMRPKHINNKPTWCFYIITSFGIGSVHYYFKFIRDQKSR